MAWADNFNVIYSDELPVDEYKIWKFQLEEHKTKLKADMKDRLKMVLCNRLIHLKI